MIRAHGAERKAESALFRRSHHVNKNPRTHRFAGEMFGVDLKEKRQEQSRERRRATQSSQPIGYGFGTKDNYGPDESWESKEVIEYKPVPEYYMRRESF